jgi:AcrR family transcriptional regulator
MSTVRDNRIRVIRFGYARDVTTPTADDPGARSLRRDAERNRVRIIRAAQEVFAAQGIGAGLNDIAHHAGVGVGTVYRRFPDKDALVAAALHDQVALMVAVAEEAVAAERAWDGLLGLLDRGLGLLARNLGLRDVTLASGSHEPVQEAQDRFVPYVAALIRRAGAEGDLRPDVTVEDLVVLHCMISEVARHSADLHPDAWRRYLRLMTDGLRARPDLSPLGAPLDADTADEIARRWVGVR